MSARKMTEEELKASRIQRFWSKVDKRSHDECWTWLDAKSVHGYGRFKWGGRGGFLYLAHRASYIIHHGEIPADKNICHSCDNPTCVNPAHLWLGTQADNIADMHSKGRSGSYDRTQVPQKPNQKISREQAEEIKRLAKKGENQDMIAIKFGVSQSLVSAIKNGKLWPELLG